MKECTFTPRINQKSSVTPSRYKDVNNFGISESNYYQMNNKTTQNFNFN